ncbi:Membrane protease subunit, stomatin/prohibitin family, contains C-terminal Zn-ribbon domain [Evansella caseinilytica]|uniref:Membrane protease subunit, stomatin/prohibitin family, contains C-terminal Zn-ribbon domain n=1 Tax=Evansella caseinilytica TaxID=1503961 RepID=A0A1H3HDL1_9BACI|nr:SPFH domain-containing protein [Evansella caseinilytica]SDY13551.1 Membrane protease subunit, stomatin/prohibitin family, contains C-terminal Zn-ribbon domain [Evansella caseinilytica]
MSFFRGQLANVVEWEEFREDMIFWKWNNREIKKGSKLILRPGQDAIFINNGKIEGVFTDEGEYNIESEIIPFLSTLKGFKFGFNSGMRVEVLFVNTKQFAVKWGTKNAINIPTPQLPGGMPIRANGTFEFKVNDYMTLIDNVAGIKNSYLVEDVRSRITTILDQLLMKWITREGKDMFNLQANADEISKGIKSDLDMRVADNGLKITRFNVNSFNYPKEIQDMITKSASQGMIGDVDRYQKVAMTDAMAQSMASGKNQGGGTATDMAGMMMGMQMANEMMKGMNFKQNQAQQQVPNQQQMPQQQVPNQEQQVPQQQQGQGAPDQGSQAPAGNQQKPNFCPNCGTKTGGTNFCGNCGYKLV